MCVHTFITLKYSKTSKMEPGLDVNLSLLENFSGPENNVTMSFTLEASDRCILILML